MARRLGPPEIVAGGVVAPAVVAMRVVTLGIMTLGIVTLGIVAGGVRTMAAAAAGRGTVAPLAPPLAAPALGRAAVGPCRDTRTADTAHTGAARLLRPRGSSRRAALAPPPLVVLAVSRLDGGWRGCLRFLR